MMEETTKEKLIKWAQDNNWSLSHPLDYNRFWDFVIEAYNNGDTGILDAEFYAIVSGYYNDEDTLTDFYIKYENGIELLGQYNKK